MMSEKTTATNVSALGPFWGMIFQPRATIRHLIENVPGHGAYLLSVLFFFFLGLNLYFCNIQDFYYIEYPVLIFFFVVAGIFFLSLSTLLIRKLSAQCFGALARGRAVRTAIAWSLVPSILCNALFGALVLSNVVESSYIGYIFLVVGVLWSFWIMEQSLGEAEAYGEWPALFVLGITFSVVILSVYVAYLPMMWLTPMINQWIWYG